MYPAYFKRFALQLPILSGIVRERDRLRQENEGLKAKSEELRRELDTMIPDSIRRIARNAMSTVARPEDSWVVLEFIRESIERAENDPSIDSRARAIATLRTLGLDAFGQFLFSLPDVRYPKLSGLLPAMASEETQRGWTGNAGAPLLRQTVNFVRAMTYQYTNLTGRSLQGASVLDFGCGYGRIARLMYTLVEEKDFHGVDPWDLSIELCRKAGLTTNYSVSDYLPETLPVSDTRFDLIYAFSVFTHLSRRAALTSLRTLRRYIKPDGLLVITVRPVEYWAHDAHTNAQEKEALARQHRDSGFAFKPHHREAIDGDVTYGDTSMSLDWLQRESPEWQIRASDWSPEDQLQRYLFLTPSSN